MKATREWVRIGVASKSLGLCVLSSAIALGCAPSRDTVLGSNELGSGGGNMVASGTGGGIGAGGGTTNVCDNLPAGFGGFFHADPGPGATEAYNLEFTGDGNLQLVFSGCDFASINSQSWVPSGAGIATQSGALVLIDGGVLDVVSGKLDPFRPNEYWLPGAICFIGDCATGTFEACSTPEGFRECDAGTGPLDAG